MLEPYTLSIFNHSHFDIITICFCKFKIRITLGMLKLLKIIQTSAQNILTNFDLRNTIDVSKNIDMREGE